MEIERKWMLKGWPPEELGLPLLYEQSMRQGYISVRPTVRIREEAMTGGNTEYVLCIKSGAGLVRKEIEMDITKDKFAELEDLIGLPLIPKVRYPTAEIARGWKAESISPVLAEYLSDDVTEEPGQTMGAYWIITRLHQQ